MFSQMASMTKKWSVRQELKDMAGIEDRWLSVEEICKYLGVSSDTVYRWIDRCGMPAHRMGRLWKFKKDQVDTWIEAGGASTDLSKEYARKDTNK